MRRRSSRKRKGGIIPLIALLAKGALGNMFGGRIRGRRRGGIISPGMLDPSYYGSARQASDRKWGIRY